jgi:tetratricopeptide (TPR) repeat protein
MWAQDRPLPGIVVLGSLAALAVGAHFNTVWIEPHLGDDRLFVVDNYLTTHPSLAHATRLFTEIHKDFYQPLPMLTYMIDYWIWGDRWAGFHYTSLTLHACNAILVYLIINRLIGRPLAAWTAASLFAVHPLAVETVGLFSGRFIELSATAALLSVLSYLNWRETGQSRFFYFAIAAALLANLSKLVLGLPAVLIAIDIWKGKCRKGGDLAPAAPFALMSVLFGWLAVVGSHRAGMIQMERVTQIETNVAIAGAASAKYLAQFAWPTRLASWYPRPADLTLGDPGGWGTWLLLAAITIGCIAIGWRAGHWRLLFGWVWYAALIFQYVGLVPARSTLVADRYIYLPMVGLLIMATVIFDWVRSRKGWLVYWPLLTAAVAVPLIWISWAHSAHRHDDLSDKDYLVSIYPDEVGAYLMRSRSRRLLGDPEGSLEDAKIAQSLQREYAAGLLEEAEANLAMGRSELALQPALEAMRRKPDYHKAAMAAIRAYVELGKPDEALSLADELLELYDGNVRTHLVAADIWRLKGDRIKAVDHYRRAVKINPYHWAAWYRLGFEYRSLGMTRGAEDAYRKALAVNPDDLPSMVNLAEILARSGDDERLQEAMAWYSRVLESDGKIVDVRLNRASLALAMGRTAQALSDARLVMKIEPIHPAALSIAVRAAVAGEHYSEAVEYAEKLFALSEGTPDPAAVGSAGFAALRSGQRDLARQWANRALESGFHSALNRLVIGLTDLAQRRDVVSLVQLRQVARSLDVDHDLDSLLAVLLAIDDWSELAVGEWLATVLAARATVLTALDRQEEAEEAAERAKALTVRADLLKYLSDEASG